jgi:hypothetical protein
VNDLSLVMTNRIANQIKVFAEASMGGVLILTSKASVVGNIRVKDSSEFTRQFVFHLKMPSWRW